MRIESHNVKDKGPSTIVPYMPTKRLIHVTNRYSKLKGIMPSNTVVLNSRDTCAYSISTGNADTCPRFVKSHMRAGASEDP